MWERETTRGEKRAEMTDWLGERRRGRRGKEEEEEEEGLSLFLAGGVFRLWVFWGRIDRKRERDNPDCVC